MGDDKPSYESYELWLDNRSNERIGKITFSYDQWCYFRIFLKYKYSMRNFEKYRLF